MELNLASPAHSASQSYELKFPTGNVTANRFLKVDSVTGSGTTAVGQLSFAEVSGITMGKAIAAAIVSVKGDRRIKNGSTKYSKCHND